MTKIVVYPAITLNFNLGNSRIRIYTAGLPSTRALDTTRNGRSVAKTPAECPRHAPHPGRAEISLSVACQMIQRGAEITSALPVYKL